MYYMCIISVLYMFIVDINNKCISFSPTGWPPKLFSERSKTAKRHTKANREANGKAKQ